MLAQPIRQFVDLCTLLGQRCKQPDLVGAQHERLQAEKRLSRRCRCQRGSDAGAPFRRPIGHPSLDETPHTAFGPRFELEGTIEEGVRRRGRACAPAGDNPRQRQLPQCISVTTEEHLQVLLQGAVDEHHRGRLGGVVPTADQQPERCLEVLHIKFRVCRPCRSNDTVRMPDGIGNRLKQRRSRRRHLGPDEYGPAFEFVFDTAQQRGLACARPPAYVDVQTQMHGAPHLVQLRTWDEELLITCRCRQGPPAERLVRHFAHIILFEVCDMCYSTIRRPDTRQPNELRSALDAMGSVRQSYRPRRCASAVRRSAISRRWAIAL